ncbi:MAG: hypothetical protein KAJ19_13385, partial [Gammaproteobacteria bacterium]|nr:hypothetical protein [Gammaproteobacteria bacterium]
GGNSHAEGESTISSGNASHAEGINTTASGDYSHAEGQNTTSSGINSHAEGFDTIANDESSHAEGDGTLASGPASHAEGANTVSSGIASHAEGASTTASANHSHAEGQGTTASGNASHSEGVDTIASGDYSHAGGSSSTASGNESFIHSTNSLVSGVRSAVIGGQNITGTTDDTVYVPYLNINNVPTGTSVNNLGIDSSGNVVIGSTDNFFVTGGTYNSGTTSLDFVGNSGFSPFSVGVQPLISPFEVTGTQGAVQPKDSSYTNTTQGTVWLGGTVSKIAGDYNFIGNGINHNIEAVADYSFIGNGNNNHLGDGVNQVAYSAILAGKDNTIDGTVFYSAIIAGENNSITHSNTFILGSNISSTQSDTTYVENLNISNVPTGTSVNNLGIDASGNVVVGSSGTTSTDTYVTGATLNGNTLEIERNNGLSAVTVDLSSLSASTPTIDEVIAAGNQLTNTNNSLEFPLGGNMDWSTSGGQQNFYISNSSAASTYIRIVNKGGELEMDDSMISLASFAGKDLELKTGGNTDDFRIYLGTNGPSVGDVLEVKSLDGNTGLMGWATPTVPDNVFVLSGDANAATQQLTFTNTTGGTFNVTNAAALFSDNDVNVTGGTYNPTTGCITFSTNSGSTFDVCGFVTGLTDTYTSSGTYDNNTAEITFTRTDASTYTVDLSTLDLNDTYVTGGTVSVPATDDSNSGNIGLFYKNSDGTPRVLPFEDTFTTGTTFSSNQATLTRNDGVDVLFLSGGSNVNLSNPSSNQIKIDVTLPSTMNTYTTGFTYNDANTLTISRNDGGNLSTTINTMTGLTVNGTLVVDTISATTINGSVSGLTLNDLDDVTTNIPVSPDNTYQGELVYFDVASNQWVSGAEYGNLGEVTIWGKKGSAGTIDKGCPVYITGFDDDIHEVELANATTASTMPVIGFTAEDFDNAGVYPIVTFGKITGLDTTSGSTTLNPFGETWEVNDVLYMAKTDGGLTKFRPTGTNTQIQRIAKVLNVGTTNGQIFIFNTARTAGLPNLTTGYLWVGNGDDLPQEVIRTDVGITVTGFTYNDNNTFTITDDNGDSFSSTINQMSGLTVTGNVGIGISNVSAK